MVLRLAGVDRDRRADIVGRSGISVQVAPSTGTACTVSSQWTTWSTAYDLKLADVDRDGRADIVGRSGSNVQVALSTGTSFTAPSGWTT